MADDIKLVFGVEQGGLLKAIKNTKTLQGNVKLLSSSLSKTEVSYYKYNKAVGDLAKATNTSKKELLAYGKALRADEKATKKAAAETKAFVKARREAGEENKRLNAQRKQDAAATALAAKEEERLKNKFVAGHTAMNIYTKELNDLAAARKRGIIGTDEQTAAIARLNAQMKAGTGAFARAGAVMGQTKNKMNGSNMAVQQLGYQFGDFAVQVQGGTSAFVAFSQQGAQLAGMLPMIAGPLGLTMGAAVGLSAALGILIPIGSAAGRMFFEMKGSAKEAAESAKRLDDKLNTLKETLRDYAELQAAMKEGVSLEFKFVAKNVKEAKADLDEAQQSLDDIVEGIKGAAEQSLGGQQVALDVGAALLASDKQLDAVEAVTAAKKVLADLEAKEAAERAEDIDAQRHAQESLVNSIAQASRIQAGLYGKTAEEQEKLNDEVELHKQLLEAGIKPTNILYLQAIKYHRQLVGNKDMVASMTEALEEAAKAQSDLEALDETYVTQLAIVNAQIKALEEGKKSEVAAFLEGERAKITALYETSKAFATQANDIVALAEASLAFLAAMGELDALAAAKTKLAGMKPTGKGSSTESPAEKLRKYLDTLGQQAELESKLVGLFGEKRNAEEEVIKARQKYGEVFGSSQEAELRGTLAQIEADKKRQQVLEEATAQQQQIADTLQSSMEDAFMSMVDGTKSFKDAMKDMARAVIKQLFEILVVQRMVGSFDSKAGTGSGLVGMIMGAFQADGGAWQGGSQIQAYANGGVVGSPTTFPMAGGKTGLMGEAGPEAIMPLKRGANGKLGVQMEGGGGDNVVIHQNFNFQANGDESVKKLIAQAAPQIANMTKSSMLNDRRRGGATKAVFG